jgi:general secretion pathway protein K
MLRATDGATPDERGFALIVVLWFLVLLAFIGIHIGAAGRTEIYVARNSVAAAHAEALAEAGVFQAIYALSDPTPETHWDADGETRHVSLGDGEIAITASDETAKIDPNAAPQTLVEALFLALDVDPDVARGIAGGVAQLAHPNHATPTPGGGVPAAAGMAAAAGINLVAAAAPPGGPGAASSATGQAGQGTQGPAFETLDDLLQVTALTPEILSQARPYLTVDSGSPKPSLPHADAIVRRALDLAGNKTAPQAPQPPQNGAAPGANQNVSGQLVDIMSTARSKDGAVFVREAVVRIDPASPPGFAVLRWQRRDAPES